ncbi:MAG: NUDIX hydrolase [Microbacterium gubbeenense]|uniref:NUDIX hydrolase n=1 Tax=Microbacterium gubbeenense TaxID=159896 RepID=UPI0004146427|nr:NUDIX domain-containing protein [Microbacterium gubbeenense]
MIDHELKRIRVSAVVIRHPRTGHVLAVRKRGTSMFMQPGGKPDPGESAVDTAIREVREELRVELDPARMRLLGVFEAPAANEDGYVVRGTVFTHPPVEVTTPAAEIEEIRWVATEGPPSADLAPLMTTRILPALRAAGI